MPWMPVMSGLIPRASAYQLLIGAVSTDPTRGLPVMGCWLLPVAANRNLPTFVPSRSTVCGSLPSRLATMVALISAPVSIASSL